MKTMITTLVIILLASFSIFAQNTVPRDKVILEIGTGTWCQYCPGAAMGADDLISAGYDVAVVENHNGDAYTNAFSNARNSFYNITGFPTANFDGVISVVGGSTTQSMFSTYFPKVNQRMAIASAFSLDVTGTHTCLTDFTAHINIEKVGTNTSSNLRLMAVLTESEIMVSWFGQDKIDFVERDMMPDQNGTVLDFSGGNTQTLDLQFSLDPSWVFENCELVVFLQDLSTKEIFQGTKLSLLDFSPEYEYDAAVKTIENLPTTTCDGTFSPGTTIRNLGSQSLTSLNLVYSVNGGDQQTYTWSGNLDYLQSEDISLPAISFPVEGDNQIIIQSENPDGNPDECTSNDIYTANVPAAMITPNTVKLILRTDANPGETTWQIINSAGDILYSGGPYTTSGQMVQETFDLPVEDCYTFNIFDSGGNGLLAPGFFMLYYGTNNTIIQGIGFGSELSVDFNRTDAVGIPEIANSPEILVRPNPFSGKSELSFNLDEESPVIFKVYNLNGQMLINDQPGVMSKGPHTLIIDGSKLKPGLYLYNLTAAKLAYSGKLTVK